VRHVAEKTATLRGESPDELAYHTNEAAEHFFRFRPKSI
jgi:Tat protein secretion system quality control protein TatD with DNase activity